MLLRTLWDGNICSAEVKRYYKNFSSRRLACTIKQGAKKNAYYELSLWNDLTARILFRYFLSLNLMYPLSQASINPITREIRC